MKIISSLLYEGWLAKIIHLHEKWVSASQVMGKRGEFNRDCKNKQGVVSSNWQRYSVVPQDRAKKQRTVGYVYNYVLEGPKEG